MLPRPLQESNVIGKGGTAGFLGAAYDPYYLFQDPGQRTLNIDDLALRQEVTPSRMQRRATLLREGQRADAGDREGRRRIRAGRATTRRRSSWSSPAAPARRSTSTRRRPRLRDKYGRHTFGQSLLLARRLIEAGTRVVQVNWPAVANGNPTVDAWDTHAGQLRPAEEPALPQARQRPAGADRRPRRARPAEGHARPRHRRVRPQPQDGRQHQRQHQRRPTAATTGRTATPA